MYAHLPKSAINHKSYICSRMFMSTEGKLNYWILIHDYCDTDHNSLINACNFLSETRNFQQVNQRYIIIFELIM